MEEKSPKKKKKRGNPLLLFIFLISLAVCGYFLVQEIQKELSIREMEADIQTYIKVPEPDTEDEEAPEAETVNSFDWDGLLSESPYVIGWIQIPGSERVNYPIVQHPEDNQYFLTRDWKGDAQAAGAIFLNRHNSSDFTDMNSVIYGHRMKSGSMFGTLKYYEDQAYLDEHPYVYIFTPEGRQLTYEIICCAHVSDGSDAYLMSFRTPEERMAYYDMMLRRAITRRDMELGPFDTTILLSTCGAAGSDYYARVVVLAKLIGIDVTGYPEGTETEA